MKKILFYGLIAVVALGAVSALAEMDNRDFTVSTVTTNVGTKSYTLRGEVEGINVVIPTGKTCTVAIATAQQTIYTGTALTTATDGYFPVRLAIVDSTGTAISEVDAGSNTNSVYAKAAMAGTVTATFTPAAGTTGTNSYTATVIYKK